MYIKQSYTGSCGDGSRVSGASRGPEGEKGEWEAQLAECDLNTPQNWRDALSECVCLIGYANLLQSEGMWASGVFRKVFSALIICITKISDVFTPHHSLLVWGQVCKIRYCGLKQLKYKIHHWLNILQNTKTQ